MVSLMLLIILNLLPISIQPAFAQGAIMEIPTQVELNVGETYTIELPSLGAAGYLWTYQVAENSSLVTISIEARPAQSNSAENLPRVGSSNNELFILKALKVGHSRVRLIQRRPWEQKQPPLKEHVLEIEILN